jgi:hypothetical protein
MDHDLEVDFAELVRSSLEAGETPDQVAQALIEVHHLLPISAIKAMRSGGSMTSDDAKDAIKRGQVPTSGVTDREVQPLPRQPVL